MKVGKVDLRQVSWLGLLGRKPHLGHTLVPCVEEGTQEEKLEKIQYMYYQTK